MRAPAAIRQFSKGLSLLLLGASPALAQMRVEPLTPRLSLAPAVSPALPPFPAALSFSVPTLAAPAAAPIPAEDELSAVSRAAAPNDDAELPARSLNAFWEGLAIPARDDEPLFAPEPSAAGLAPEAAGSSAARAPGAAPWLALKDRKFEEALDAAVKLARGTRVGRRAFAAAEQALDAAGIALPVDVLDLGRNYGEFDYVEGRLRLDRKLFLPGREAELAGTLAHELLHVAQHAQGLPSNALELEIEAHLQDLELLAELGAKPPRNTFARQTYDALRRGPKEFIALIEMAVPGSPFLGGSSFEEIEEQLEQDLERTRKRRGAKAAGLAKAIAADLDMLRTPSGRRTYKNFSRRVLALLKARAAEAAFLSTSQSARSVPHSDAGRPS